MTKKQNLILNEMKLIPELLPISCLKQKNYKI